MSLSAHNELTTGCDGSVRDTYIPLLHGTQAYLHSLLQHQVPDSVLTAAWEEFYRVYNELIRRFVIARGIRDADVDDCVQEVWSEVAARLVDFRRPANRPGLRAWLYTLVRSKATDLIRRNGRHAARSLSGESQAGKDLRGNEPDPAAVCDQQWESAMLQTAMNELRAEVSELNYRVLEMRQIEGHDVAEVAAALSLTSEQVRYRQRRMLRKLRVRMAVYTGKHFGEETEI